MAGWSKNEQKQKMNKTEKKSSVPSLIAVLLFLGDHLGQ